MLSTLVMELDRDPRMGRNEEAYTEDPYLYMRIGEEIVHGTQGTNIAGPDQVIAVLTDFPTQSSPASGLERGAIELSERSLRENDMFPWIGVDHQGRRPGRDGRIPGGRRRTRARLGEVDERYSAARISASRESWKAKAAASRP